MFGHLIDEKNVRIRKRVFMTATERRYQGSSETILSMDDVDTYGETFDLITFKEALEQENPILSDYKIVTMVLPFDGFKPSLEQFQDYYQTNTERPFCKTYIDPKLAKIRRQFGTYYAPASPNPSN